MALLTQLDTAGENRGKKRQKPEHAHVRLRPMELPFTAEERDSVTILFGGLTWKHERLIEGLLAGAGYRSKHLPETDRTAHEIGKEFCASGLCNPVYFTVGNLIRYLQQQERGGLSRQEILKKYIFFTAACGGPCRFGLYESEFRTALAAAGYEGFRILSFSQDHGIYASTGHTGLQFSVDFGMNAMHAFILGDLLNSTQHSLRSYEVQPGATDAAIHRMADQLGDHFKNNRNFELGEALPKFLVPQRRSRAYRFPNTFGKLWSHLYGEALTTVLPTAAKEIEGIEVDWLRVKPVVKVVGEFWAQMTESDGNFRMMEFLEKEGAEVSLEPISSWLLYMLHQKRARLLRDKKMAKFTAPWTSPWKAFKTRLALTSKRFGFKLAGKIYLHHFRRLSRLLGVPIHMPVPQVDIAAAAAPFYDPLLRGGEGHLEVGKTLYYTRKKACHLVLALKPFGCLPSIQSDGVQAALVGRFPQVSFLPIETSAEGAIHAYSRVQMALSEAREKARLEFARVLQSTHYSLGDMRSFIAEHPELRHPFYPIPRHSGVVSTAANFALHVDQLMSNWPAWDSNRPQHRARATKAVTLGQVHSTQELES
jgi:predicted nucleotide-binding protein (sugar kinase/HSP70/actin superfamily)